MSDGDFETLAGARYSITEAFTQAVAEAEKLIANPPFEVSAQDLAEGYDYLAGSIRSSLQMAFDYDLEHPVLINPTHQYARQGLDNPDAVYFNAYLAPDASYVVTGVRGTTADLSFQVMDGTYSAEGAPGTRGRVRRPRARRSPTTAASSGASAPSSGSTKGSTLIIREVYSDWNAEQRGTIRIQRLDTAGQPRGDAHPGAHRQEVRRGREDAARPDQHLVRVPGVVHLQGAGEHADRAEVDAGRAGLAVLLDRPLRPRRRRGDDRDRPGRRVRLPGDPDRLALVHLHRLRAPPDLADQGPVARRPRRASSATSSASATPGSPTGWRPAATRRA